MLERSAADAREAKTLFTEQSYRSTLRKSISFNPSTASRTGIRPEVGAFTSERIRRQKEKEAEREREREREGGSDQPGGNALDCQSPPPMSLALDLDLNLDEDVDGDDVLHSSSNAPPDDSQLVQKQQQQPSGDLDTRQQLQIQLQQLQQDLAGKEESLSSTLQKLETVCKENQKQSTVYSVTRKEMFSAQEKVDELSYKISNVEEMNMLLKENVGTMSEENMQKDLQLKQMSDQLLDVTSKLAVQVKLNASLTPEVGKERRSGECSDIFCQLL